MTDKTKPEKSTTEEFPTSDDVIGLAKLLGDYRKALIDQAGFAYNDAVVIVLKLQDHLLHKYFN